MERYEYINPETLPDVPKQFMELGTTDIQYIRASTDVTLQTLLKFMMTPEMVHKYNKSLENAMVAIREEVPKLKVVDTILHHHILEKERAQRVIIIIESLPMGLFIEAYLRSQGYKVLALHAGTRAHERNDIFQMWTLEANWEILIMSAQIGGAGLNLQRLCHVIIMWDRQSNVAMESLSIGRIIRRDQPDTPIIYRLVMLGTIDQGIDLMNYHKWETQGAVFRNPLHERQTGDDPSMMSEKQLFLINRGYLPGNECPPNLWRDMTQLLSKDLARKNVEPDSHDYQSGERDVELVYNSTSLPGDNKSQGATKPRKRKHQETQNSSENESCEDFENDSPEEEDFFSEEEGFLSEEEDSLHRGPLASAKKTKITEEEFAKLGPFSAETYRDS